MAIAKALNTIAASQVGRHDEGGTAPEAMNTMAATMPEEGDRRATSGLFAGSMFVWAGDRVRWQQPQGATMTEKSELLELTAEIVAAHVGNNTVTSDQLPTLIQTVHQALSGITDPEPEKLTPAVPIKGSVQKEAIICLDCGKSAKMLKPHLTTAHGLSVQSYRERWDLPRDYPMTAPNYAAQRSALAKKIGLGRKPGSRGRKKS